MSTSKIATERMIEGVLHVCLRCNIAYTDKTTFNHKKINNVLLYIPYSWLSMSISEDVDDSLGIDITIMPLISPHGDGPGRIALAYMPTALLRINVDYGSPRTKSILSAAVRKANMSESCKYVTMNVTGISEIPNRSYQTWHKACVKEIIAHMRFFAEKAAKQRMKDDQIKQSYLDKINSILSLK